MALCQTVRGESGETRTTSHVPSESASLHRFFPNQLPSARTFRDQRLAMSRPSAICVCVLYASFLAQSASEPHHPSQLPCTPCNRSTVNSVKGPHGMPAGQCSCLSTYNCTPCSGRDQNGGVRQDLPQCPNLI